MTTATFQDALPGDQRYLSSDIGFELVGRALRTILMRDLNAELANQQRRWLSADLVLQQLGDPIGQVEVPPVPAANFFEGPHKSLIEAPVEMFPNISVMAFMTVPSASQFADSVESSELTIFVESLALSGPVGDGMEVSHETIVHRRIQRMTEAVAVVVERDPGLMGTVHELRMPARGGIGNSSWKRPKEAGAGDRYIIHGSRLQYTAIRHHS